MVSASSNGSTDILALEDTQRLEAAIQQRVRTRVKDAIFAGVRQAFHEFEEGMAFFPAQEGRKGRDAAQEGREFGPAPLPEAPAPPRAPETMRATRRRKPEAPRAASHSPEALTQSQAEVLRMVQDYVDAHGFSPTYAEISAVVGKAAVANILYAIAEKGWITLVPHLTTRKIEVLHRI